MTTSEPEPPPRPSDAGDPEGTSPKSPAKTGRSRTPKSIDARIPRPSPTPRVTTRTETTKAPAESESEERSRLGREEADHAQAIWERKVLHIAGLVLFGSVILAAGLVLGMSSDPQARNWATAALTSLVTGFLTYLLGRQQSK